MFSVADLRGGATLLLPQGNEGILCTDMNTVKHTNSCIKCHFCTLQNTTPTPSEGLHPCFRHTPFRIAPLKYPIRFVFD